MGLTDSTGIFTITGSPVTTSGNLTISALASQTANKFLASPNGSSGAPTFRGIVAADVPTLNQNTSGTAANITATSNSTLTTLSGLTTASSLVSMGTITTGVWHGTSIANANLANSATTVNGQTCTLGSTCTVTAAASSLAVGTTTIGGGTSGNVEYNNAGVLGELATTGSGNVVLANSPTFVTSATGPIIYGGTATGSTLTLTAHLTVRQATPMS